MTQITNPLAVLFLIALFVGCGGTRAPQPDQSTQDPLPDAAANETTDNGPQQPPEGTTVSIETDPPPPVEVDSVSQSSESASATVVDPSTVMMQPDHTPQVAMPVDSTSSRHRFVLMARGGPLIVDLRLSVGGQPLDGILEGLVDQLLALGDSDEDGRVTWQELLTNEKIREEYAAQFNLPGISNEAEQYQLTRRYDVNRNRTADREEIPRLFSQGSAGARPFTIRGSNYYREFNRYQSETLRNLDQNRNGKLEAAEITNAKQQLQTQDFDNDQHLTLAEFGGRTTNMDDAEFPKNELDGDVVCLVNSEEKRDVLLYTLQELYVDGDDLAPGSFGLTPLLFGQLDIDENQHLDQTELASFADVPAHITIAIDFGSHPSKVMKITEISPELSQLVTAIEQAGWIRIKLPTTTINFFLRDQQQVTPANSPVLALLASGDKDEDEQVTSEEFDEIEWPEDLELNFDEIDRDDSGSIDRAEAIYFANRTPGVLGGQVHCRVRHDPDALFAELDSNADTRLNPREIRRAPDRLRKLDTNKDNFVDIDEVPDAISIGVWRGNREARPGLFANSSGQAPQSDLPSWFVAMDTNQDGEIGDNEFLGNPQQFQQLDADTDGYLTIAEVEALTSSSE